MHQENDRGVKRQVYQGSTGKPTLGRRDTFPPLPHNALTQAIKKAISGYRRYIFYPYLDPIVEEDFFPLLFHLRVFTIFDMYQSHWAKPQATCH